MSSFCVNFPVYFLLKESGINLPILYSFRRCPYAIRTRYVLAFLGVKVELREVVLKDKPDELLSLGGRSTVPQLIDNGVRFEESLDIIFWAIEKSQKSTPEHDALAEQLWPNDEDVQAVIKEWIDENDNEFKGWLDKYKYSDRFPEYTETFYREKGEVFLEKLECRLKESSFLLGDQITLLDIAIFPFVRQFSGVNMSWFEGSRYLNLRRWLSMFIESELFKTVMEKYPKWESGQEKTRFP
ncbi:glutathione S-transferase [Marinomonas sp. 2405UD68-3]|uniref:glutathione S-transferase n=1 Tax=Marinomonas sp. 2405UD68-3 TaxID=3391835 RepID=UPI0039C9B8C7